jgi:hypothetical protein
MNSPNKPSRGFPLTELVVSLPAGAAGKMLPLYDKRTHP